MAIEVEASGEAQIFKRIICKLNKYRMKDRSNEP